MNKLNKYILSVGFIIFLMVPHFCKMTNIFQTDANEENRQLAAKPKADINNLDKYPGEYNAYFNDNFGLRTLGVKIYNDFNYFFLKKSPAPKKAILGKDGWLFQGRDINLYRGSKRLTPDELNKLEVEFNKRCDFLNKNNCTFIFVLVPTKKGIYPEYLPDEYFRYSDKTMSDQFLDMLRTKTKVEVLDLRPVIKNAKKKHEVLYHKMDNHWNDIGAYYSYKSIIDFVGEKISFTKPRLFEDYALDTTTYYGGSIAKMLGVQDSLIDYRIRLNPNFKNGVKQLPPKYESPDRFPYPGSYERRYKIENKSLPRLMMINDSFGEYLYRFMPEHFSYSLFLFDGWEFKLHAKKVLDEKPDIFVLSTFEGFIPNILDNLNREENQIPNN